MLEEQQEHPVISISSTSLPGLAFENPNIESQTIKLCNNTKIFYMVTQLYVCVCINMYCIYLHVWHPSQVREAWLQI